MRFLPSTIGAKTLTDLTGTTSGNKHGQDVYVIGGSFSIVSASESTRVDEPSSTITYVGKAAIASSEASAVWQIFRLEQVGTELEIKYADGDSSYDNIWNNRASLTYT